MLLERRFSDMDPVTGECRRCVPGEGHGEEEAPGIETTPGPLFRTFLPHSLRYNRPPPQFSKLCYRLIRYWKECFSGEWRRLIDGKWGLDRFRRSTGEMCE